MEKSWLVPSYPLFAEVPAEKEDPHNLRDDQEEKRKYIGHLFNYGNLSLKDRISAGSPWNIGEWSNIIDRLISEFRTFPPAL